MSLLQMSVSGAVMILVITVIRALAMNRVPKKTFLVLWGAALQRLLIPFSLPSSLSIYSLLARKAEPVTADIPAAVFSAPSGQAAATVQQTAAPQGAAISVWSIVWAAGAILCAAVFAVTYWKCCREFQISLPVENEVSRRWLQTHRLRRTICIRQSDRVSSPLTFGVFHPVILMPKKTDWSDETALQYVLEHEFVHIRRFDTVSKLLLIAAVCVHWFDPMVWVMYVLANRDMELSCDETVVRRFGSGTRASYARVLISIEETRSGFAPLCNHFSRNAIEERITAIMKTKKITVMSLLLAAALVVGTVAVFATSAKAEENNGSDGKITEPTSISRKAFVELVDHHRNDVETEISESSLMSYVDPADGKTYYSFDDGKTFEPLTDAEFEARFPTPNVEWWTYDEFKAWLDNEKAQLQSLLGESSSVGGQSFTWTQEEIDKTIAMYEGILADIQNGVMYSKSVDGQDDQLISYHPADISVSTDTE